MKPQVETVSTKRLNAVIPKELHKRFKEFCAREDIDMKDATVIALENFMNEMEGELK